MNTLMKDGGYEIILTLYRKIRYQESLQNLFFKVDEMMSFLYNEHTGIYPGKNR